MHHGSGTDVPFPVFVINLARATERWQAISSRAAELGIALKRVEATDGRMFAGRTWPDFDETGFHLRHGREPLPGEYGCYRSHMDALDAVIASAGSHALILEDDVALPDQLGARLSAIIALNPAFDLVKLVSHRTTGFVAMATTRLGDRLGRTLHGPTGSSAAYLIARSAAPRLREKLGIMQLPYDIALERGWHHGLRMALCRPNLVELMPEHGQSDIVDPYSTTQSYRAHRLSLIRRVPTGLFRGSDYLRRSSYALGGLLR